ncbi:MAG: hypothetical protein JOS17DRAFT_304533 [Linnemannia elongata]|nr:MAG: hypothetical protein JOS17DRAFT_304533 [Linnemannia elongata]
MAIFLLSHRSTFPFFFVSTRQSLYLFHLLSTFLFSLLLLFSSPLLLFSSSLLVFLFFFSDFKLSASSFLFYLSSLFICTTIDSALRLTLCFFTRTIPFHVLHPRISNSPSLLASSSFTATLLFSDLRPSHPANTVALFTYSFATERSHLTRIVSLSNHISFSNKHQ